MLLPRATHLTLQQFALCGVLMVALALHAAAPAQAQEERPPSPFSKLSVYTGGNALVASGDLGDFYRFSPGGEVGLATPFYAGVIEGSLGLRRFEGLDGQATEDLWAAPLVLRWGLRPRLGAPGSFGGRLRGEASVGLGLFWMNFSGGTTGLGTESELLLGADAGLSMRLVGRWRLATGVRYERVFTSTPLSLWQTRAGLRARFDAPRWFQRFLR